MATQDNKFYLTNVKNVAATLSSIQAEYPTFCQLLDLDALRRLVKEKGDLLLFPKKDCSHINVYELAEQGIMFFLTPGFTYGRHRHRTRLNHACWFSRKPEIMFLTVRQAMIKDPKYMIWVYKNLSINWSLHCIANFEFLIKKYNVGV